MGGAYRCIYTRKSFRALYNNLYGLKRVSERQHSRAHLRPRPYLGFSMWAPSSGMRENRCPKSGSISVFRNFLFLEYSDLTSSYVLTQPFSCNVTTLTRLDVPRFTVGVLSSSLKP